MKKNKKNSKIISVCILLLISSCTGTLQEDKTTKELFSAGLADVVEYRIPSLICTPSGTLIAMVDARVDRKGDIPNNVDLAIRRSEDGGETWGEVQIIVDYGQPEGYDIPWGAADAAMVYDTETSTLWALYTMGQGVGIAQSQPGLDGLTCQIHSIYSKDEGKTWSEPIDISPDCKALNMKFFGTAPGVGIQTGDGSLVFCIYTTQDSTNIMTASLIVSNDHGKSWERTNAWGDGITSVTETQIVELPGGTWIVNSRNHYGIQRRLISTSNDRGSTWSAISHDEELPCPTCMASLISIPHPDKEGEQLLIFANPASEQGRKNGTVRVSDDYGQSWKWSKLVEPDQYAYSCLTQLKNGSIGLFYEAGESKLFYQNLTLDYLTDGIIK
ncbi:MAG TPA: exo-alpha-sialidase [Bacteroides sp.]|nr:exo-alpha-sialidase [Bacteroides sp.]